MEGLDEVSDEEILDRRLLEVFYGKATGEDEFDEAVIERILGQGHADCSSMPGGIEWVKATLRKLTGAQKTEIRNRIKLRLTGVLHRL